ncbi:GRP family sugar transporter [Rarobacter faecitabidus]|uniref:Glucose uptake protein n=1 Tax=Rarobacter faecitabidus TaxID=13243 RepID=A0A542ZTA3_RARFA|nr:GRP family sugar transporter [Rarobacter faecitabidus]TQL63588.1 glucose uptake protein [Rarobacter faecitabidus]
MSDILIGLIPAFGWGMQGVVMQKLGGRTPNKQMGMVLTALVVAIAVFFIRPPATGSWTATLIIAACLNGAPWAVGQILQIRAFELMGVSRAMPISTGMQLLGATLVGVVFFHEWRHGWQFGLGVPALLLLIFGVWLTTYSEKSDGAVAGGGAAVLRQGFSILLLSSLGYVLYATSSLIFSVDPFDLLFPQSVVMVVTTLIISLVMSDKNQRRDSSVGIFGKKTWLNMVTGILFAAGNLAALLSIQRNGAAVGWTLAQMNVIISTVGGLVFLRERKSRKELFFVLGGLAFVAVGGILIGVTKN